MSKNMLLLASLQLNWKKKNLIKQFQQNAMLLKPFDDEFNLLYLYQQISHVVHD